MSLTIKSGGKPFDWPYFIIMTLVILGLLLVFLVFVVGPIDYFLERR